MGKCAIVKFCTKRLVASFFKGYVVESFFIAIKTASRWAAMGVLVGLLPACAGFSTAYPPAPVAAPNPDYNYIVGPGDTLNIIVWRNPELSLSVPVRPDGKVSTPLVDELVAQGKTSVEIARDVEKALSKLVRDPVVTIIVTSFVGPYSEQIRVIGEAAKPQALPYKQKMTVLDVMIAVGGLTDFADGNGASITRASEGDKRYSVRLKDLILWMNCFANYSPLPEACGSIAGWVCWWPGWSLLLNLLWCSQCLTNTRHQPVFLLTRSPF